VHMYGRDQAPTALRDEPEPGRVAAVGAKPAHFEPPNPPAVQIELGPCLTCRQRVLRDDAIVR